MAAKSDTSWKAIMIFKHRSLSQMELVSLFDAIS